MNAGSNEALLTREYCQKLNNELQHQRDELTRRLVFLKTGCDHFERFSKLAENPDADDALLESMMAIQNVVFVVEVSGKVLDNAIQAINSFGSTLPE